MTIGFSPRVIAFMVVSMLAVGHARQGPDIGLPVPPLGVGPFEFDTAEKQKIRVSLAGCASSATECSIRRRFPVSPA